MLNPSSKIVCQGRPFFICGHLEDRFEKPSVSGIRPNQRQASSFPPEQTTRLWKAELFLANVIWISANLSPDCLQDLGQFSQPNRFSHRIEREAFMAWINNKPLLWLEVCAGEMKALL